MYCYRKKQFFEKIFSKWPVTPTFFSISLFSSTCSCGGVKKSGCLCSKYLTSLLRHVYVNRLVLDLVSARKDLDPCTFVWGDLAPFCMTARCAAHCAGTTLTLSWPGGAHCAPQVHFLKYLRNALSYGLETFWQFKWTKLKNKNLFFNRLCPPLVTIATFKVDACFWKAHFGSFHANAYQNSMFFAISIKTGRNVVCCENLGFIFRKMASWWQFSFRTLFRASTTLKWTILSPWQREWCHSIWFFISFQKTLLLLTFNKGNMVFHFWMGIPSQKSETYEPP